MKKTDKPNYYSIIPAEVRYDKELKLGCRLLYGEITSLCNKKGFCWASNRYFAELYDVHLSTIQNWLNLLKSKNYIKIEIIRSKEGTDRKIYLGGINQGGGIVKLLRGDSKIATHNSKERREGNSAINVPISFSSKSSLRLKRGILENSLPLSFLEYWNSMGKPLIKHRISTKSKTYNKIIKLLSTQLKKYEPEVIRKSIKTYYELLNTKDMKLLKGIPGHVVGLDEFFGFSKMTKERMKKANVSLKISSWFDECRKEKGLLKLTYGNLVTDFYPKITNEIIKLWKEWKKEPKDKIYTVKETNCFRIAASRFYAYWEKKIKTRIIDVDTFLLPESTHPEVCIHYMFECIDRDVEGKWWLVYPTWLASKKMFEMRLDKFFIDKGMVFYESRL